MKTLKTSMLVIAIMLCFVFSGNVVDAAEINSINDFKELIGDKNVTFNEKTITLNEDVDVNDVVELNEGEYTLNLNGHTFKAIEFYVNGGKLTIDDSTKKGKVDTRFLAVDENATLVINQGIFSTDEVEQYEDETYEVDTIIDNWGTVIIKNAIIESGLWNSKDLTVEYAEVPYITQYGTAIFKDGKYSCLLTDTDSKTTIYGGEFKGSEEENAAFIIQGTKSIDRHTINTLFPEGYVAKFTDFTLDTYGPDEEGVTYYTGIYGPSVEIVEKGETYSDIFKKITTDGVLEVEALKPTSVEDSEFILSAIVRDIVQSTDYEATAYAYGPEFNPEKVLVCIYDGENTEEHVITVKYLEPTAEKATTVKSVLSEMKYYETNADMYVDNAYILDDLHLINYLFSNTGKNKISGDEALNFAKDLIAATNGANISFKFDSRSGSGNPNALYSHAMGQAIVYYDGEAFTSRNAALTASHVLYIPDDTADTDEAYIAAALKRIKNYIGQDANITITIGGKFETLTDEYETYNEYNLFDETKTLDNYYVFKINGKLYNFAICKKETSKLETPKYVGKNLGTEIYITSDVTTIPLDTAIKVNEVEETKKDTIKKALGTDEYVAYDISLYSNSKKTNISKLDDGNFSVSIPVPENLKNKDLVVYYVADDGKKTEHTTVIKDGIALFETNHFSTYVLAEKVETIVKPEDDQDKEEIFIPEKDVTPNTGSKNNMVITLVMGVVAIFGINLVNKVEKVNVK